VGLTLVAGPANAGKVARLLERYLARLDDEPTLIVPNRSDVDRVERDLLARCGCLFAGSIGTFDDLFGRLAGGERRAVATDVQRALVLRNVLQGASLNGLERSARTRGFADTLLGTLGELESGLLDPGDLDGDLARLYAAYRLELDRLALWDRDLLRRRAAERLASDLDAWSGEPVFAYGFEDLTGAEWQLLEALAGRADVEVSLPYEPGRVAFASLQRTAEDLAGLADGRIEELGPRSAEYAHPALAHLERALFEESPPPPPELDAAVRFLEGAGLRGTLELMADEVMALLRSGTPAERIAIVAASPERSRRPLETALGVLDIPYAIDARIRLGETPFGHALLQLLRFAWQGGDRRELFAYLRSPYSGIGRGSVDFVEGRLRGRAVHLPERVEEETERLREAPVPALAELREAEDDPVAAVRDLVRGMIRSAYGLDAPPAGESSRLDLRADAAVLRTLDELDAFSALGETVSRDVVLSALDGTELRLDAAGEPGRVAVLDLMRARTPRFDVVFVLGLEEGTLPRRSRTSPFLGEDARRELGSRLERPDQVSRDRYLFYTACTRATRRLYLVREAATDEGASREASPFWEEVASVFDPDDVARATTRRSLAALTRPLEGAPTERERLRAVAVLAAADADEAEAVASANDWSRRLDRARSAWLRPTRLTGPVLTEFAAKATFGVTELERFADCSSAWLHERIVDPRKIDAEVDALLRGSIAHQTLFKFYAGLPKELGTDAVTPENVEQAIGFLRRCLEDARRGGVRLELTDLQEAELMGTLWRDLEGFVRDEAASPQPLVPRRFEVGFGSDRSAPELQRGLRLAENTQLSGKIDRIDVDPFSARGIVHDYKSGRAHSAKQIDEELKLQIPLYLLVLRDLVGIEPLGGLYRSLSGARVSRGLLRQDAADELTGYQRNDYLPEDEFWSLVETARERAAGFADRIRKGDVRHDPKGGDCPTWCDVWPICRVERA
jgi:ATP-dependent helicase/DNAse subunit B